MVPIPGAWLFLPEPLCLLFFGGGASGPIMLGLPLASMGAVGATAGPSPAAGVAVPADPVAIFDSALGNGGVAGGVAIEPVETAVVD
jgi:hypothetical protein